MNSKWVLEVGNSCSFVYERKSDDDLPTLEFIRRFYNEREELDEERLELDTSEAEQLKRICDAYLGDRFGN